MFFVKRAVGLSIAFLIFALVPASAMDWPEDYVVRKNSTSPDGRHAVLVETPDAAEKQTTNEYAVYLADVKAHTALGKIEKVDYFEHQNHSGLEVFWAPDSSYCVVENDGRYGLDYVILLKLKNTPFEQVDLGKHGAATQKRVFDGYLNGNYRFTSDGKLKVRALSYTNPKEFAEVPTYHGLFQGTFDLKSGKWTSSGAKKIKEDDWGNLQTAYYDDFAKHMIIAAEDSQVPEDFTGSVFRSQEEKLEELDKTLNEVYQAVRSAIPPNRFAKVKQEQVAWLKTRDSAKSADEKSKLTEDRIKALQDLLW